MRGFLSLPLIPAATTPPPQAPPGLERVVRGAPRRAPTRAHPAPGSPLPSLPPLSTPRLRLPPSPGGDRVQSPSARREFGFALSGALELSGRLSRPRVQRRNGRSRLSPAAAPGPAVCLQGGCVPCPSGTSQSPSGRVGRRSGQCFEAPHGDVETSAVQGAAPKDLTTETARRGPGISPRLVPARRL